MKGSGPNHRGIHRLFGEGWGMVSLGSSAPAVMGLGVFCSMYDSWVFPLRAASAEVHWLFGLLLLLSIISRFHWGMKDSPRATAYAIEAFSRNLARKVYLLLYGLLGLKMVLGMGASYQASLQGFRDYLIDGIAALVLIRALAAKWHRGYRSLTSL